jgi:holo-[acyl-carrier protein] synthase
MIIGIGSDIVSIDHVANCFKKQSWAFVHRILGKLELDYFAQISDNRAMSVSYLARRFAAKEAALKALGTGITPEMDLRDVQILNDSKGKPELHIEKPGLFPHRAHVTITDNHRDVVAFVLIESN